MAIMVSLTGSPLPSKRNRFAMLGSGQIYEWPIMAEAKHTVARALRDQMRLGSERLNNRDRSQPAIRVAKKQSFNETRLLVGPRAPKDARRTRSG